MAERCLGAEGQRPHPGVEPVRPHDQVEHPGLPAAEGDVDAVAPVVERGDPVVEDVLDVVAGGLPQHPRQVAARELDGPDGLLAEEGRGAQGRDLAAPLGDEGQGAGAGAGRLDPLQEPHPLDDVDRHAPQVDRIAAPAHRRGLLDDGDVHPRPP